MASVVDLFCGAGGLTHGLEAAGLKVNMGFDIDPACEYPYTANNKAHFCRKDVTDLTGDELLAFWDEGPKILVGCAPCQTFSTYVMGKRKAPDDDRRWKLITEFARLVKETSPDIVSMENVPRAEKSEAFQTLVTDLKLGGYKVYYSVVNCNEFNVPQSRRRLVLLASLYGDLRLTAPSGMRKKTVREAIGHLPEITNGIASSKDPLHYASKLSELNQMRTAASLPGGTWKDWPEELKLACHKKKSGRTYRSVYGRMQYDDCAPTLTTLCLGVGNGRFTHPVQNRGISVREAALLQSFPESYKFVPENENVRPRVIARLIGNAVPVNLGNAIGVAIQSHLELYEALYCSSAIKDSARVMH